jgi:hypothetical protein
MDTTVTPGGEAQTQAPGQQSPILQIRAKLDTLPAIAQNLRLPYGHGKAEPWWRVISENVTGSTIRNTKSIYGAKREATKYVLRELAHEEELTGTPQLFDEAELNVMRMLRSAAKDAGLENELTAAALCGSEAVWSTSTVGIGYEPTFALKGMMMVVEHLTFDGKQTCIDFVEDRINAVLGGFVPVASIRGGLVVCKIEQSPNF